MSGKAKVKSTGKTPKPPKITDTKQKENEVDNAASHPTVDTAGASYQANSMEAIQANIIAEIQAAKSEQKKDFEEVIDSLKKELTDFREDINQKLNTIATDLKDITDRVEQAEERVAEVEEWSADTRELFSHTLEFQESIQTRLTDLEARSRRNNMRIHGIPEGAEGDNIQDFVEKLIKTELSLTDTSLGIQRCHRSLGPKPPPGANPRSVIVYFLEYKTKEKVLRSAWGKKEVHSQGKRIFFEQDYPTEIVMKRKAYFTVRKALKGKELRFQTLYPAKLKVHYTTGPVIYNDAQEAKDDLKKRGIHLDPEPPSRETIPMLSARRRDPPWEAAGGSSRRHRDARLKSIRDKLRTFRRGEEVA